MSSLVLRHVHWLFTTIVLTGLFVFNEDSFQRKRQRFAKESHREVRGISPINQNYSLQYFDLSEQFPKILTSYSKLDLHTFQVASEVRRKESLVSIKLMLL